MAKKQMNKNVVKLCESAIMIALAAVLSFIKILSLPYGGSVTAFSVVPLVIIAYRHGTKWGLLTGFVFSLIQLIQDTSVLTYATSIVAAVAIVMLDYILAFSCMGLSGVFRNIIKNPVTSAVTGTIMVCVIRFICHVISGCTVWAGVSIPSSDGLIYSLSYNATYMIPETIINAAAVFWIFSCLNFRTARIERARKQERSTAATIFSSLAVLSIITAIIIDAVNIFGALQNAESGELDITLISSVNFGFIGIITAAGVVICAAFAFAARAVNKKKNN